jgi:hypothetical protein
MLKLAAPYVLTTTEFNTFASIIENIKTPSSHVSTMAQYIRQKYFGGLKSHNYHVLMQQMMPLALRGLLAPRFQMAVIRISRLFRRICNKVLECFTYKIP